MGCGIGKGKAKYSKRWHFLKGCQELRGKRNIRFDIEMKLQRFERICLKLSDKRCTLIRRLLYARKSNDFLTLEKIKIIENRLHFCHKYYHKDCKHERIVQFIVQDLDGADKKLMEYCKDCICRRIRNSQQIGSQDLLHLLDRWYKPSRKAFAFASSFCDGYFVKTKNKSANYTYRRLWLGE